MATSSENVKLLKSHVSEQWEIDAVGDFLLELYKQKVLGEHKDWNVSKQLMRDEFARFLKKPGNEGLGQKFLKANGTNDIGTLLFRTKFLINTQRGSNFFRIRKTNLCTYRDSKLDEYDERRKNIIGGSNGCGYNESNEVRTDQFSLQDQDSPTAAGKELEINYLNYEGSQLQGRKSDFVPSKRSCFICQMNFSDEVEFEDHISFHSQESNFESLKQLKKFDQSIWKVSYKLCENSHFFCFIIETDMANVVIEKIIVVQTHSMYYVHNDRVPYKIADGKETFYVNSQLFTEYIEQPVIILFHANGNDDMRLMEQHHFVSFESFPVVQMGLNPQRLSMDKHFLKLPCFRLSNFYPSKELVNAYKHNFPKEYLLKISPELYDYFANSNTLTESTYGKVMEIFLQMEDLEAMNAYYNLIQREINLRQHGAIYSFKLLYLSWSPNFVGGYLQYLPKPEDEVFLIPETLETITLKNIQIYELLKEQSYEKCLEVLAAKYNVYVGTIKRVTNRRVHFSATEKLPIDKTFVVIIRPARIMLRSQFRILEMFTVFLSAVEKKFLLFPSKCEKSSDLPLTSLVLQNEAIQDDVEQLQAVRNITANLIRDVPYIILGGPGTGKTAVIVESILQLYLRRPETKILVTAGTDSACDEIALRLCKVLCKMHDEHAIARIYENPSDQRREKIDELLLEYSNIYSEKYFLPSTDVLNEFRVLVCTIQMVSKLYCGLLSFDDTGICSFTHIFLDEAASVTEPEALVGILNVSRPLQTVVLAGDPKQLDPLLYSSHAREMGLGKSLLERLLARDCFNIDQSGNYDRSIMTKLVRNYRSHPAILNFYNTLYYDKKLIAPETNHKASSSEYWYRLRNPNFPIIFHSVESCERDVNDSIKYADLNELDLVMNYVMDLMYFGVNGRKLAQQDVGIISPYKDQVLWIQEELNLRGWYQIEVGIPENFQGREKSIIILSLVCPYPDHLDILDNSRRLNFMISRAKSILIIIGNSKALSENKDFKFVIDECYRNYAFQGQRIFETSSIPRKAIEETNEINGKDDKDCIGDDNDGDEDDTRSVCSVSGAKKKNRKRRKKTAGSNVATNDQQPMKPLGASNIVGELSVTPEKSKGTKKQEKIMKSKENPKNEIDELLESLPSVPSVEDQTAKEAKCMENEIAQRLRNLNLRSTAIGNGSTANDALKEFVIVDKPNDQQKKDFDKPKRQYQKQQIAVATPSRQQKIRQQINHTGGGGSAAGGQVKRLHNNNTNKQQNIGRQQQANKEQEKRKTNNQNTQNTNNQTPENRTPKSIQAQQQPLQMLMQGQKPFPLLPPGGQNIPSLLSLNVAREVFALPQQQYNMANVQPFKGSQQIPQNYHQLEQQPTQIVKPLQAQRPQQQSQKYSQQQSPIYPQSMKPLPTPNQQQQPQQQSQKSYPQQQAPIFPQSTRPLQTPHQQQQSQMSPQQEHLADQRLRQLREQQMAREREQERNQMRRNRQSSDDKCVLA